MITRRTKHSSSSEELQYYSFKEYYTNNVYNNLYSVITLSMTQRRYITPSSLFLPQWMLITNVRSFKATSPACQTNIVSSILLSSHTKFQLSSNYPRLLVKATPLPCRMATSFDTNLSENSIRTNACEKSAKYYSVYWFRNAL
jgi:hypothetical protein